DRVRYRWGMKVEGVVVAEAERGGWAQMAGLRLDDLLLTVNDQAVKTVPDFERVMKKLAAERPAKVRLFVRRRGATHFVIVEPTWRDVDTKAGAK
ncbi:MAG TPA: PDZ domain-containing protein, partial [Thermoanaerobaculia bacterium]|nr:PDZ domain-containing protein [Thermoanaerobaculia bacterium]